MSTREIVGLLVASSIPTLAAMAWLRRSDAGPSGVGRGALGYAVGLAAGSLLFVGWRAAGGSPSAYVVLDALFFSAALVTAVALPGGRGRRGELPRGRGPRVLEGIAGLAVLVSAAMAVAGWLIVSRTAPLGDWDAWAMWNTRARFLFLAPTSAEAFWLPRDLHPDYPLMLPAAVARLYAYMGATRALAPIALAISSSLAVAGFLWAVLRRFGLAPAVAGTLLLLGTSTWLEVGRSQYADVPLGMFVLMTYGLLAGSRPAGEAGGGAALVAGFCAGAAVWTKNEGALHASALGLAWLLSRKARGERSTNVAALVAGAAIPLLATVAHKAWQPGQNEIVAQGASALSRVSDPTRWAVIGEAFGRGIATFGDGVVFAALAASWLLPGALGSRRPMWPLWATGMVLLGFGAVFLVTPYTLEWHIANSLPRLFVQCWPVVLLALFARETEGIDRTPRIAPVASEQRLSP